MAETVTVLGLLTGGEAMVLLLQCCVTWQLCVIADLIGVLKNFLGSV